MPSAGDGVDWDVTIPTDSGEVADTGLEMREIKLAAETRLNKEHVDFDGDSVGGEHEKGSARAYYQDSYPTLRPDGVSDLDTDDVGRLLVRAGAGEFWLEVWNGTGFTKIRPADAEVTSAHVETGFLSNIFSYAIYSCQLGATDTGQNALGANLGDFNSGGWRTRTLNTEVYDTESFGSLASNQITLAAGTYRIRASAPALEVNYHQVRWRNVTDSTTIGVGNMALSAANDTTMNRSEVEMEWTLGHTAVYELQHRCSDSNAAAGMGAGPGSFGVVWNTAQVEIWKLK